jgi:hypothetical protein
LQDINEFLLKYHLLHKFAFIGFFRFFEEVRIAIAEVKDRLAEWRTSPIHPDVADYFLYGPGASERPFCDLLALI